MYVILLCVVTAHLWPWPPLCWSPDFKHNYTHNDAPQSVGLLWTSDQLIAEAATYTTRIKHKGRTSMNPAEFESAIPTSERPQASTCAFINFTHHKRRTCSSHRLYWLSKFAQFLAILFSGSALFFPNLDWDLEYPD